MARPDVPLRCDYFVLRQKSTGGLFPAGNGHVSYREFSDDMPPRLYKRAQDAMATARFWVMGHSYIPYSRRGEYADPFDYVTRPVEGRLIDDLEAVPVQITLPGWESLR